MQKGRRKVTEKYLSPDSPLYSSHCSSFMELSCLCHPISFLSLSVILSLIGVKYQSSVPEITTNTLTKVSSHCTILKVDKRCVGVCVCVRVYLMIGVFKLAIVDPSVQKVDDWVRNQAKDVLYQSPHLWVSCFTVRVNGWGKLTSLPTWPHTNKQKKTGKKILQLFP